MKARWYHPQNQFRAPETRWPRWSAISAAVLESATLLGVLTAGPDSETAMARINRVITDIRSGVEDLPAFHDDAMRAVQWLATRGRGVARSVHPGGLSLRCPVSRT